MLHCPQTCQTQYKALHHIVNWALAVICAAYEECSRKAEMQAKRSLKAYIKWKDVPLANGSTSM